MFAVIICFIISYLLGSINTSIIVSRIMGSDVRNHGSGNAGATNMLRTFGKKAAFFTTLGDMLKAVVAVLITGLISKFLLPSDYINLCKYISGIAVVLGHNYPLYFGFKGGKGIVTSLVVGIILNWQFGIIALLAGVLTIAISKYVSLGSILGISLYFLLSLFYIKTDIYFVAFAAILAAFAIYRHSANIKRLVNGCESKIGHKKE